MSISTMLDQLRVEIDDSDRTRWTDPQLKTFIEKSIRRVNQLAVRNELDFAQVQQPVTFKPDGTIGGIDYEKVNAVGKLIAGNEEVRQLYPMHWYTWESGDRVWTFVDGVPMYKPVFDNDVDGIFIYYPRQIMNTTESPWDGRLDDIVVEYAAFRAKNVDEMSLQADKEMLLDLEQRLIQNYVRLMPSIAPQRGWNI